MTFWGPSFEELAHTDPQIADIVLGELDRQRAGLQLIASENFTSPAVLAALGSTLSNKYAEGYPGRRYYGGCVEVDKAEELGKARALEIEEKSIAMYRYAHDYAMERGIIIADTKMEFGLVNGEMILIDELLTPDSSRFWDASQYQAGRSQPSFDKQPVRDWLVASGWNKEPPAPMLPEDVIEQTAERYREAYRRLTGKQI